MDFLSFRYRNREDEYEDPRRDFLVKALTLGLFTAGGPLVWPDRLAAMSTRPRQVPPGRSIYRLRGDVRVNGVTAGRDTLIGPTDDIETGSDSELVFVLGSDAFIMRENGHLQLATQRFAAATMAACADDDAGLLTGLRLITGKLLSVFGGRPAGARLGVRTPTATIGVRGTGIYVEAGPDRSYVCTCYGTTRLGTADPSTATETITASHHDAPRFILGTGPVDQRIQAAPVINHTDMELVLLEELVGREPPFTTSKGGYEGAPDSGYAPRDADG